MEETPLSILSHVKLQQMVKNYHIKFKNILKSHIKIPKKRLEESFASSKVLLRCSDFIK